MLRRGPVRHPGSIALHRTDRRWHRRREGRAGPRLPTRKPRPGGGSARRSGWRPSEDPSHHEGAAVGGRDRQPIDNPFAVAGCGERGKVLPRDTHEVQSVPLSIVAPYDLPSGSGLGSTKYWFGGDISCSRPSRFKLITCELWLRKLERAKRMVPASSHAGYASSGSGVSGAEPEPSTRTTQTRLTTPEAVEPFGPPLVSSRPLM